MEKIDIRKIASEASQRIPADYDLGYDDLQALILIHKNDGLFDALCTAFLAGFALGHQATISGDYKENIQRRI